MRWDRFLQTVLATLPVTTATNERSFSTMKRIKTFYRSKMNDARLSGLALLAIHSDVAVEPNDVISIMAKSKQRKLLL